MFTRLLGICWLVVLVFVVVPGSTLADGTCQTAVSAVFAPNEYGIPTATVVGTLDGQGDADWIRLENAAGKVFGFSTPKVK